MEIIYRVYEIVDDNVQSYWQVNDKVMLDQTICICDSRENFKDIMKDLYSPKKVHFANSKKLQVGDIIHKYYSR